MIEEIKKFIITRQGKHHHANHLGYLCQGGSYISGTNDETSDFDFRSILLPSEESLFGLDTFSHSKLVSGEGGINGLNDLDIELFSASEFLKRAYRGEVIPFEMLYVDEKFQLIKDEPFKELLDKREIFLSKSIIYNYLGLMKSAKHQTFLPLDKATKPDRIDRIVKHGYETKQAMKIIQFSTLWSNYLQRGEISLYRKDARELISIKNGKYSTEEIKKVIKEHEEELESLLSECSLSKKPDFKTVNSFSIEFQKKLIKNMH